MSDLRLALPAAVAWVTLGILIAIPQLLGALAVVLWGVAAAAGVAAMIIARPRLRAVAGMVIVTAAVTAMLLSSAAIAQAGRRPGPLLEAANAGRFVTATAVTGEVAQAGGRGPLAVTLTAVKIGRERLSVKVPALVFGALDVVSGRGIGTALTVSGTLSAAAPEDRVAFLVFIRGSPTVLAHPPWYLNWANALRARFLEAAQTLPGDGADLLPGLSIGDTSAVSATLDAAMKTTSLSHLTAVSGANCAVVIALIMLVGGAIGMPRGWRIAASLAVLAGFVVLVTPEASVLRSAVMATLVLIALASGRPLKGVPVLALAVIILLVLDPWLSRSFGFILSVLATAGLLVLAGPLTRVLARWLPTPVAAVIAIPLAAQLACQPVIILLNPVIPAYGVVANLLSGPAAPLATVLGLTACVLLPILAPLGTFVAAIAWLPSSWIAAVARFFANLPGSQTPWLPGAGGVTLLAVVTALTLLVILWPGARRGRVRTVVAGILAVLFVGYLGVLGGGQVRQQLLRPTDWQIAACDIGQGDAVLVRSNGEVALIDTGPDPVLLTRCLRELAITRIQLLVLTHYDLDHVGGTAAVLGLVDKVLVGPISDAQDTRLRESLTASGAELQEVSQGLSGRLGDLAWRVLWPPKRLGGVQPGNDASVTMVFEGVGACPGGCLSSIFLGDLGDEPQARAMAANRVRPVDLVKVAHHGSADQNARMYQRLQATVGLIGVGIDNSYGHPTATLLGILSVVGTVAERTDLQGMILLSPGEDAAVRVWSERAPPSSGITGGG